MRGLVRGRAEWYNELQRHKAGMLVSACFALSVCVSSRLEDPKELLWAISNNDRGYYLQKELVLHSLALCWFAMRAVLMDEMWVQHYSYQNHHQNRLAGMGDLVNVLPRVYAHLPYSSVFFYVKPRNFVQFVEIAAWDCLTLHALQVSTPWEEPFVTPKTTA